MEYAVVIERTSTGYSAYVPDLPGCVAAAETAAELKVMLREAIEFHLEGMRLNGEVIPLPSSQVAYVEVAQSEAAV